KNTPTITQRGGSTKIPGPCIRSAHPKNEGASLAVAGTDLSGWALDQRRPLFWNPTTRRQVISTSWEAARRRQLPTGPFFLAARRRHLLCRTPLPPNEGCPSPGTRVQLAALPPFGVSSLITHPRPHRAAARGAFSSLTASRASLQLLAPLSRP